MPNDPKWKAGELDAFRKVLRGLSDRLRGDLTQMTDEALHLSNADANGSLSKVPIHLADLGTETFDQELTLGMIENEQATLEEIQEALGRLDAGDFGRCQACDKPIARARLQAIPYARHCIDCARDLEGRSG